MESQDTTPRLELNGPVPDFEAVTTHGKLRRLLLETGSRELVEQASSDYYWGCGADGSGRNMLGRILAETRARLRDELA